MNGKRKGNGRIKKGHKKLNATHTGKKSAHKIYYEDSLGLLNSRCDRSGFVALALFHTTIARAVVDDLVIPFVVIGVARLDGGRLREHDVYATARTARCGLCAVCRPC